MLTKPLSTVKPGVHFCSIAYTGADEAAYTSGAATPTLTDKTFVGGILAYFTESACVPVTVTAKASVGALQVAAGLMAYSFWRYGTLVPPFARALRVQSAVVTPAPILG